MNSSQIIIIIYTVNYLLADVYIFQSILQILPQTLFVRELNWPSQLLLVSL